MHIKSTKASYSFIPTYYIKEGISHKMDAFLKPLIDEVTNLYINGIDVTISEDVQVGDVTFLQG